MRSLRRTLDEPALSQSQPGMPSQYQPPSGAWVGWLQPADLSEAESGPQGPEIAINRCEDVRTDRLMVS